MITAVPRRRHREAEPVVDEVGGYRPEASRAGARVGSRTRELFFDPGSSCNATLHHTVSERRAVLRSDPAITERQVVFVRYDGERATWSFGSRPGHDHEWGCRARKEEPCVRLIDSEPS